jgi:hypothetical protein
VIRGLNGDGNCISFPFSGCINIEANIRSEVLSFLLADKIVDLIDKPQMTLIDPALFTTNPERAFSIMMASKITVTCDSIEPWALFLKMRAISKK